MCRANFPAGQSARCYQLSNGKSRQSTWIHVVAKAPRSDFILTFPDYISTVLFVYTYYLDIIIRSQCSSMSNSDAVKSGLHCLEVDGAGRDMSQEPESIQALSHSIHVARLQRKGVQDREWQMFSDVNVYQYTSILLKLPVLWQDRLQRVNDDCNRVCLDCKCPKLAMQGPEQFFQWRVQTAFWEVPSSLRVDGCWPNQRISGQGKWSRSSDLIASDPVFCWTSLSCQSEFHQNQNSMIPVSQPHECRAHDLL